MLKVFVWMGSLNKSRTKRQKNAKKSDKINLFLPIKMYSLLKKIGEYGTMKRTF